MVKKKFVSVAEDDTFLHVGLCCKLIASQMLLEESTNMETTWREVEFVKKVICNLQP